MESINVKKVNVDELLKEARSKHFLVPEYQRPYAWQAEQVEMLFEDMWEFACLAVNKDDPDPYFLGCVVAFENEKQQREIIDGQQRITSLFLLLRAIYTNLENIPDSERSLETNNFIRRIQERIWEIDEVTGTPDYASSLLTSEVLSSESNQVLLDILRTGQADETAEDNYSRNYRCFQSLYEKHAVSNPGMMYKFILSLLDRVILMSITAGSQETALTIFSTLNDRGMPLSEADIYKAKIYNHLDEADRKEFVQFWREMDERAARSGEGTEKMFYYYMFYLRALEGNVKSSMSAARKYYAENKFSRLFQTDLMDNLFALTDLWNVANKRETLDGLEGKWSANPKIRQALDMLSSHPNDFWKIAVSVYYLAHRRKPDFEKTFNLFLHKLLGEIMIRQLLNLPITKSNMPKLDVAIVNSPTPAFTFKKLEPALEKMTDDDLHPLISTPPASMVRMLLKTMAYESQSDLLPEDWEIEHILPQKWEASYTFNQPEEDVRKALEHIGNKLPFEKKLNIVASNGYFSAKKKQYKKSSIKITKQIGNLDNNDDWNLIEIVRRDVNTTHTILEAAKRWNKDYAKVGGGDAIQPAGTSAKKKYKSIITTQALGALVGEVIYYSDDENFQATVVDENKVRYNGDDYPLGGLTKKLKGQMHAKLSSGGYQGTQCWSYQGRKLSKWTVPELEEAVRARKEAEKTESD